MKKMQSALSLIHFFLPLIILNSFEPSDSVCACVCMCDSSTMQNTVRPQWNKSILSTHFIYKDKFHFVFPFLMSKRHSHHRWKRSPLIEPGPAPEPCCRARAGGGIRRELAGRGAQSHPRREEPGVPAQPRLERAGRPGTGGAGRDRAQRLPGLGRAAPGAFQHPPPARRTRSPDSWFIGSAAQTAWRRPRDVTHSPSPPPPLRWRRPGGRLDNADASRHNDFQLERPEQPARSRTLAEPRSAGVGFFSFLSFSFSPGSCGFPLPGNALPLVF